MAVVQELVATLGLNVDEQTFNRGLLALKGLTLGLAGIGAAVGSAVVGIGAVVKSTAEAAAEVKNLSTTANVSSDFFQGLAYAAGEVGFEIDDLRDVFLDLSERALDAKDGAEEYTKVFKTLGVTVTDGTGKLKNGEQILREVSDGFAKMPEGAERAATASKLLGETGARLLPVLLNGAAGLDEYMTKARDAGAVMSGETLKAAVEFRAESVKLEAALAGVRNEIGAELLPEFTAAVKVVAAWVRVNRKMITTPVVKFFRVLAGSVQWVADNLDLLKGALLLVTSFMVANYLTALSAVTGAQVAWGVAALISGARAAAGWALATAASWLALAPLALLISAIVLLADEIWTFAEGGDTLLGRWIKWLDQAAATDGPLGKLLELFKAFGSLVFDFTDIRKWARFGSALKETLFMPFQAFFRGLRWVKDTFLGIQFSTGSIGKRGEKRTDELQTVGQTLNDAAKVVGQVQVSSGSVGKRGEARTDQLHTVASLFGPNSSTPGASLQASPTNYAQTYSPSVTADVTVNVGEGVSPRETGDAVAKAVSGEWWQAPDQSANFVAVDQ